MGPAFRCEVCLHRPDWRLDRVGDAVVSWACDHDLAEVVRRMQRPGEVTQLVIRKHERR